MESSVDRRTVIINGHKTSVSLEEAFWIDLKQIARAQGITVSELVAKVHQTSQHGSLSSAIRVFILEYHLVIRTAKAAVAVAAQALSGGST
jgi:predicted DNA-binding ribbon-helix-helix protein